MNCPPYCIPFSGPCVINATKRFFDGIGILVMSFLRYYRWWLLNFLFGSVCAHSWAVFWNHRTCPVFFAVLCSVLASLVPLLALRSHDLSSVSLNAGAHSMHIRLATAPALVGREGNYERIPRLLQGMFWRGKWKKSASSLTIISKVLFSEVTVMMSKHDWVCCVLLHFSLLSTKFGVYLARETNAEEWFLSFSDFWPKI